MPDSDVIVNDIKENQLRKKWLNIEISRILNNVTQIDQSVCTAMDGNTFYFVSMEDKLSELKHQCCIIA